jgi:hypothetical protein
LLKPIGTLIASVPNIREVQTLYNLILRRDWKYVDDGVLEKSHLRFFCKKNMIALISQSGAKIESFGSDLRFKSNWRVRANRVTAGLLEEFLVTQYLFIARRV